MLKGQHHIKCFYSNYSGSSALHDIMSVFSHMPGAQDLDLLRGPQNICLEINSPLISKWESPALDTREHYTLSHDSIAQQWWHDRSE